MIPLDTAPFDKILVLEKIENEKLAIQLQRIGIYEQSEIIRLDESLEERSVRIRGPRGDVVLGAGMGVKTIVHLDDNRKLPVRDMKPGDTGHIECFHGGMNLAHTLEVLGLSEENSVTFVRLLPPMGYITRVDGRERLRLSEGDAAKIWGESDGKMMQFSLVKKESPFRVKEILGGKRAHERIKSMDIRPGLTLFLEGVEQACSMQLSPKPELVITSIDSGIHLHLPSGEGRRIWVSFNPDDMSRNGALLG